MDAKRRKPDTNNLIKRALPSAQNVEDAVLGGVLLVSSAIDEVIPLLSSDMFYDERNKTIYEAVLTLKKAGKKIDLLTVCEQLKAAGMLAKAGGIIYINELTSKVASTAHLEYWSEIVRDYYIRRRSITIGNEIFNSGFDDSLPVTETVATGIEKLKGLETLASDIKTVSRLSELAYNAVARYGERAVKVQKGDDLGVATGLQRLDSYTGGWQPTDLIIFAGRPSMGKTQMMLYMALMAARRNNPVFVVSEEMSKEQLTDRLIILEGNNIDRKNFRFGRLDGSDEKEMYNAANRLSELPVFIDDTSNLTISKIKAKARRIQREKGLGLIVIDYLQLLSVEQGNKNYNREQEVAQISKTAKAMSKELRVPVLLLSQLSREVEKRSNKIPILSDLRESGAIEQDADLVLFIHRPDYYDKKAEKKGTLRVAKNREGKTGDLTFYYNDGMSIISDNPLQDNAESNADTPF